MATDRLMANDIDDEQYASNEMRNELATDLQAIRRFAQSVRPVAENIRRSLSGRRSMGDDFKIIMNLIKTAVLSVTDFIEEHAPSVKPLTKYVRIFTRRVFHSV